MLCACVLRYFVRFVCGFRMRLYDVVRFAYGLCICCCVCMIIMVVYVCCMIVCIIVHVCSLFSLICVRSVYVFCVVLYELCASCV